jgi:type II secretory pathway pseudopilin PulG
MTLLELVATLAVLALAAALAAPRLLDRGGLALDAAAAQLRDALGFGRERASRRRALAARRGRRRGTLGDRTAAGRRRVTPRGAARQACEASAERPSAA